MTFDEAHVSPRSVVGQHAGGREGVGDFDDAVDPRPLDVLREGLSGCQMTRLGPSLQAATRGLWTRVWWTGVGA